MSDADWDAEDFEPVVNVAQQPPANDKWAGEDEEEEVKDNWDDDEGEEKSGSKPEEENDGTKAVQVKKKRPLKEILAEKEAQKKAEVEKRLDEAKRKAEASTPEAIAAAKHAALKAQEESDLKLAKEAFGISDASGKGDSIDAAFPTTKEEFESFRESLTNKIIQFEKSTHYVAFLDDLFREVSLPLEAEDLKKLGSTLTALSNEKIKQQKASAKGKKKKKGVTLTVSRGDGLDDYEAASFDGYDDFI